MPTESFRYKPLEGSDSIRLLVLSPRLQDSDQPICYLKHVDLEFYPRYEALSYCWGNPQTSRSIVCEDTQVSTTENLYQALRKLQTSSPRVLWVDAICINQADGQEKGRQVQLMGEIYSSASRVLIWLGENVVSESSRLGSLRSSASTENNQILPDGIENNGYLQYLNNPYWTRGWTLQESLLSGRKILNFLNYVELDWENFWDRIWSELEQLSLCSKQRLPPASRQALQFYSLISSSSAIKLLLKDPTLSDLDPTLSHVAWAEFYRAVNLAKRLHFSDPRDAVYSLLGLAKTLGVDLPPPDYSKSTALVFQEIRATLQKITFTSSMAVTEKSTLHKWGAEDQGYRLQLKEASLIYPVNVFEILWSTYLSQGMSPDKPGQDIPRRLTIQTKHLSVEGSPALPNLVLPQSIHDNLKTEASDDDSGSEEITTSQEATEIGATFRRACQLLINEQLKGLVECVLIHLKPDRVPLSCHGGHGASITASLDHQESNRNERQSKESSNKRTIDSGDNKTTSCRKRINDDDDNDDDPEGPPQKQLKQRTIADLSERYACPYFQRNSQAPRLHSACRGPGFPSVHRIKEHLYRGHHIHLCDRCGEGFISRSLLTGHLRSPQVCQTNDWRVTFDRNEGFEDSQRDALKRRGVKTWDQIFKILFPDDDENFYPPQHHCNEQFVQFLDRFRVHYFRETQELVPQRLVNAPFISGLNSQQFDTIQGDILRFVTELHNEIVQTFRTRMLHEAAAEAAAQPAQPSLLVESVNIPNPSSIMLDLLDEIDPTGAVDPSFLHLPFVDFPWNTFSGSPQFASAPSITDHGQPGIGNSPSLPGMGARTAASLERQLDVGTEAEHNNANKASCTNQCGEKDPWTVVDYEFI